MRAKPANAFLVLALAPVAAFSQEAPTTSTLSNDVEALRAAKHEAPPDSGVNLTVPVFSPATNPVPIPLPGPSPLPRSQGEKWVATTQSDSWLADGLRLLATEKDREVLGTAGQERRGNPGKRDDFRTGPTFGPTMALRPGEPFGGQPGGNSLMPAAMTVSPGSGTSTRPGYDWEKAEATRKAVTTPAPNPYLDSVKMPGSEPANPPRAQPITPSPVPDNPKY